MNLKRFSVRFNLDDTADKKAWDYLHRNDDRYISREIIAAVNKVSEFSLQEDIIRKVVSEELKKVSFCRTVAPDTEDAETEDNTLDFLNSF